MLQRINLGVLKTVKNTMTRRPYALPAPLVLRSAASEPITDQTYTRVLGGRDNSQIVSRHLLPGESLHLASVSSTQTLIAMSGTVSASANGYKVTLSSMDVLILPGNSECSLKNISNAGAGLLCIYSEPVFSDDFVQDRAVDDAPR
jgi:quercetin dioxygenase-like cupin family protein